MMNCTTCENEADTICGVSVPLFLPHASSIGTRLDIASVGERQHRAGRMGHSQCTRFPDAVVEPESKRRKHEL